MRKFLAVLMGAMLLTMAFAVAALAADVVPAEKETVTFDVEKGKVTFGHKIHAEGKDCRAECHHQQTAEEAIKKCSADACHAKGKTKVEKGLNEYDASHKKEYGKSCVGCHAAKAKGPTKCNDCHKK